MNSSKFGFSALILLVVVALALIVGGFLYYRAGQQQAAVSEENIELPPLPETPAIPAESEFEDHMVKLKSQNNSNQEGLVALMEESGKVKVVLQVESGAKDIPQPAHIHIGSCAGIGGVKYPLENVINGKSETTLNVTLADLIKSLPLAINVHKSAQQVGTYVSCGDITAEAPPIELGDEDEMASPPPSTGNVVVVDITGKNFTFSKPDIRVKQGDKVRINFTSTSGFHDWKIDEFNAQTKHVSTGQSASVEFVADKTGSFEYYCSVGTHREQGMRGVLKVE